MLPSTLASPQTSFGVRLWMRDKRTPKNVCAEATSTLDKKIDSIFDDLCNVKN